MARKSINNVDLLKTEEVLTGKQDWEINTPKKMTEKEKKIWYRNHVEATQAGSPNMRKQRKNTISFIQTKEDVERSKYQDHLGNPLPGYKWDKNQIVIDVEYREKNPKKNYTTFNIVKSENRVL